MTRFALFSDLHIHQWSEFSNGDDRLNDCISVLSDVRAYCVEHGIGHCFFGGDLFHKRGVIHTRPYARVADELRKFKDDGVMFGANIGNHDQEDAAGTVHALQPLMSGGLVKGVGRKGWRSFDLGDARITLFSYCDSVDTLSKRIDVAVRCANVNRGDYLHIGIFHHGFKGAKVGSVLEYEVKEPIDARKLKLDDLFVMSFSGHYHSHQAIVGVANGWYVGSPLEHTRSDRTEDQKGFLVVDTETMTFKRVPLNRPRFVSFHVGDDTEFVHGHFVDVTYDRADAALDSYLNDVRTAGARGVQAVALSQSRVKAERRLNVSPTLAPSKVLTRYLKHRRKDMRKLELSRSEMLSIGLDLVKAAIEGEKK